MLLQFINLDCTFAVEVAIICAQLEKKDAPIGLYDLLIAALRSKGMILVTSNNREFERIDDLGLENWAV